MKIALFQLDTKWERKDKNLKKVSSEAQRAKQFGASILCLPEMFSTGFSMNAEELGEQFKNSKTIQNLKVISKKNCIALLGSIIEKQGKKYYNTAFVINKNGKLILRYRKIHLFPLSNENKHYSAGKEIAVFKIKNIVCGIAICYDLRFPELFRKLVKKGAKIIFVSANWPLQRREHWFTLLRARAIENQCFVVGINRSGKDPNLQYNGNSIIFDAFGNEIANANNKERLIITDIKINGLEKIRKKFPFLKSISIT